MMIENIKKVPCPICGKVANFPNRDLSTERRLLCCSGSIVSRQNIITWRQPNREKSKVLGEKFISLLRDKSKRRRMYAKYNPLLLIEDFFLSLKSKDAEKISFLMEQYYQELLENNEFSEVWREKYLHGVARPHNGVALDFGCGRGRNISHLRNCGYQVCAQDIYNDPWWANFSDVEFQVTPPGTEILPWPDQSVDLVFSMQVIGFFDSTKVETILSEFDRVLKPGGYVVLVESNKSSYAATSFERYYGRPAYKLSEIEQIGLQYFEKLDSWYELYYSHIMPRLSNQRYFSKFSAVGKWLVEDDREKLLPPERRGMWVLRMHKPYN